VCGYLSLFENKVCGRGARSGPWWNSALASFGIGCVRVMSSNEGKVIVLLWVLILRITELHSREVFVNHCSLQFTLEDRAVYKGNCRVCQRKSLQLYCCKEHLHQHRNGLICSWKKWCSVKILQDPEICNVHQGGSEGSRLKSVVHLESDEAARPSETEVKRIQWNL
jgi:hypothetical protein